MSEILGVRFKKHYNHKIVEKIKDKLNFKPKFEYLSDLTFILADGLNDNFYTKNSDEGFVVSGFGFDQIDLSIIKGSDWERIINGKSFDDVSGIYSLVYWKDNNVFLKTDKLGLSSFYILKHEFGTVFSSRLDWLVYFYEASINQNALSLKLTLSHMFTETTILNNIEQLSHCGSATINSEVVTSYKFWYPAEEFYSYEKLIKKLRLLLGNIKHKISLGLSGGIDSRTILALFPHYKELVTHTIGEPADYDLIIAKKISRELNLKHFEFFPNPAECNNLFRKAQSLFLESEMNIPFEGIEFYDNLSDLYRYGYWLIDGGYLMYLRRTAHNKILFKHKTKMLHNKMDNLFLEFKIPDSKVLNNNIINMDSARDLFSEMLKSLPLPSVITPENWIDLFHQRYRYAYCCSPIQRIFDKLIPNISLGANEILLNLFYSIPLKVKSDCRLNVKIISDFKKELLKFPFARWNTTTPVIRGKYMPYLYSKMKIKLFGAYVSQVQNLSFMAIKEELLSFFDSSDIDDQVFNVPYITDQINLLKNNRSFNMKDVEKWFKLQTWFNHVSSNKNSIELNDFLISEKPE
ncbi:MAG: asparagine synthase-related protein [Candidatus Cloacimonetes bacterium]|nr:asparagine synthase-related protein [Candidatus Cloacimonadota bacterium]